MRASKAESLERANAALALRRSGHSYDEIAKELGYSQKGPAQKAVMRALRSVAAEDAKELRELQGQRLDELYRRAFAEVERNHYAHGMGRLVKGPHGEPVEDAGPKLAAIRTCCALLERQARLFGLDEPAKRVVEVVTEDLITAKIRELEAQLGETA